MYETKVEPLRILIEKKASGEYMVMYVYPDDGYDVMSCTQSLEEAWFDAESLAAEYDPVLGILDTSAAISDVPRTVLLITAAGLDAIRLAMKKES